MAEKSTESLTAAGRHVHSADSSSSPATTDDGGKVGLFSDSERWLSILHNQLSVDVFLKRRSGSLIRIPAGEKIEINELLNADLYTVPRYVTIQYNLGESAVVVSMAAFLRVTNDGFNLDIKVEGAKRGQKSYFSEKNYFKAWDSLLNYTLTNDRIDVYNNGTIWDTLLFSCDLK